MQPRTLTNCPGLLSLFCGNAPVSTTEVWQGKYVHHRAVALFFMPRGHLRKAVHNTCVEMTERRNIVF